jgi:sortase (surface protein transpeptidase)
MTVYHDTPQVLSQNVDLPVLTLITCKFYNSQTNSYDGRIVVKAKLASIS